MIGISIRSKYIFISFLQTYFSGDARYKWDIDPRKTKIIIADKYAVETGVAAMRPSIIFDRGSFGWTGSYRNEAMALSANEIDKNEKPGMIPRLSADRKNNYKLTDLIRGSMTMNVIAKDPYTADYLANEVFYQLSGYREWFKEKGIHKMDNLTVGKETIARASSAEVEVTVIPVSFTFTRQETIVLGQRLYNGRVYVDGEEIYENIDFVFNIDGTSIILSMGLDTSHVLTIDYVDAITLDTVEGAELVPVGAEANPKNYNVPNNGKVYGFFKILEDVILNS